VKSKVVRAATLAAAALVLTLLAAACGGGGSDSDGVASLGGGSTQGDAGDGATTGSNEDREDAELAFARCMREHGVDFPDPVNGRLEFKSKPGDEAKVQAAQEACGDLLEDTAPQLSEEQEAAMQDAALAFARCMREHGVDVPDPQFPAGGGILMQVPEGASPDDPKVQDAQEACQPILNQAQRDAGLPPPEGQDADVEGEAS
jgi:hypothetical protein